MAYPTVSRRGKGSQRGRPATVDHYAASPTVQRVGGYEVGAFGPRPNDTDAPEDLWREVRHSPGADNVCSSLHPSAGVQALAYPHGAGCSLRRSSWRG